MKLFAKSLTALIGASSLSYYLIAYFGGRSGSMVNIAGIPATVLPFLVGVLALGLLLVILLTALIRKRDQPPILVCTGLSALLFLVPFFVEPEKSFQAGLRKHLISRVTPEELRQIANEVQASLPEGNQLPGPMKPDLWSEDYRESWDLLTQTTAIDQLDPSMVIYRHPNSVSIAWGEGRLTGVWGVTIEKEPDGKPGDIAPGIQTYLAGH